MLSSVVSFRQVRARKLGQPKYNKLSLLFQSITILQECCCTPCDVYMNTFDEEKCNHFKECGGNDDFGNNNTDDDDDDDDDDADAAADDVDGDDDDDDDGDNDDDDYNDDGVVEEEEEAEEDVYSKQRFSVMGQNNNSA
ncbi:hypothetical protein DPMN_023356 [Dreissena polymorpha]|uniref:Uncharacterized protein n=1 Tax=Dreissena polymorpha TaxID=45954 RepID=A0A9D4LPI2_DREPO|nr:hypothetical protein DPMN_023356 [Dreissena polymorpha]